MSVSPLPPFKPRFESLPDAPLVITPARIGDSRGWFSESYNQRRLAEAGFDVRFVQDNLSFSAHAGTLRGLHYQSPPHAQGKLVGVMTGAIRDVVVDVRDGSDSYGQWAAVELSEENGRQLWVPPGFLHGFVTLTDNTRVAYKVTDYYSKEHDGSVAYNDPDLGVDWGVDDPVLSDKDAAAPRLKDVAPLFPAGWEGA
ncbi:dTDP-4-dehydrorhamnose 3,5-epimerase [Oceanicaulis alexandrii]|uniref:dTDP-4-dehydrorhamnose 3,5-epimerase n=1 Tax=Oceanicaulis alexandrii TaxID=153233 RepID=UPI0003B58208|nr:dTDP-4-dehydrorhamnose 3,5-epimerase [Oceanicaulis alexandrii]